MKTFICEFNMEMYPFDTQRCLIDIQVKEKDDNFIALSVGDLGLQRGEELMQYMIIKYAMRNKRSALHDTWQENPQPNANYMPTKQHHHCGCVQYKLPKTVFL